MKKLTTLALVAMTTSAFAVEHYGTLRGSRVTANQMDSDLQPTFANEGTGSDFDKADKTQMDFTQSRYGINFEGANVEFDFAGNNNTAGATATDIIRLRSLHMTTNFGSLDVTFGKAMTQMAGVNPHTNQISDLYNFAGNTGFVNDLLRLSYDINKNMKIAYETTSSGDDDVSKVSPMNHGIRFDWMNDNHHVGVAHKMGTAATSDGSTPQPEDFDYSATKLFYNGSFGKVSVAAEYYMAVNGGNIDGTSGNGSSAFAGNDDVNESGYFASVSYDYGKGNAFVGMGSQKVDNASDVVATAYGNAENADTWVGFDYEIAAKTDVFVEYHMLTTTIDDGGDEQSGTFMEIGLIRNF
jgi:hypothetical protein